jgi:lactate dehydrogenase-like 2-hydroxyacid dehydrogenase
MKPDVLSIGSFPPATMVELAERFAPHHHAHVPQKLEPSLAARIRGIATEANRGASRALIALLPKLEIISLFGVGLGGIGRAIADRGAALRMRVIYTGPRRKPDAPFEYVADLVELARRSDYLMVACKGGPETRHLISAAVIDALGPKGTLVNVARGSVVDESALIAALSSGRLGFAALDVFQNSPNVNPAFLRLPNVILQPHQGSATVETRTAISKLMLDNLIAWFERRPLLTPVT